MYLSEAFVAALRSMRIAPPRTALTTCGIVLGITGVIVIGSNVVNSLFGGDMNAAVGSRIYVSRLSMRVIGVLAPADQDRTCCA